MADKGGRLRPERSHTVSGANGPSLFGLSPERRQNETAAVGGAGGAAAAEVIAEAPDDAPRGAITASSFHVGNGRDEEGRATLRQGDATAAGIHLARRQSASKAGVGRPAARAQHRMRFAPSARLAGRRSTTTGVMRDKDIAAVGAARAVRSLMAADVGGNAAGAASGVGGKLRVPSKRVRSTMADGFLKSNKPLASRLTPEQVKRIRIAFDSFASPLTESITAKDLRPLLLALGDIPTRDELHRLIILVDADGNGLIDFEEFLTLVAVRSKHKHSRADVTDAFKMFDLEDTGVVAIDHLRHALKHLAQMSDEDIDALVEEATDGDKSATHIDIEVCVDRIMSY